MKSITFLAQDVTVDNKSYLVAYLYLNSDQNFANNFLIFDRATKPMKLIEVNKTENDALITSIMKSKNVEFANKDEQLFIRRYLKKYKEKFHKYLKHHVNQIGEVLHWNVLTGYPMAYVFDGSMLSKIFVFNKEYPNDFSIVNGEIDILPLEVLLAVFEFIQDWLSDTHLKANLYIQIAKKEFIAIGYHDNEYTIVVIDGSGKEYKIPTAVAIKNNMLIKATDNRKIIDLYKNFIDLVVKKKKNLEETNGKKKKEKEK